MSKRLKAVLTKPIPDKYAYTVILVAICVSVVGAAATSATTALATPLALEVKGTVDHCLNTGHKTAIMAILKTSAGPAFEAKYELGAGGYKDANLEGSWMRMVDDSECPGEMKATTTADFPGDWQPLP